MIPVAAASEAMVYSCGAVVWRIGEPVVASIANGAAQANGPSVLQFGPKGALNTEGTRLFALLT